LALGVRLGVDPDRVMTAARLVASRGRVDEVCLLKALAVIEWPRNGEAS